MIEDPRDDAYTVGAKAVLERDPNWVEGMPVPPVMMRPLTRREKIRLGKQQRAEARAKMTPEERAEDDRKRAAQRQRNRKYRKPNVNSRPYRWAQAVGNARTALDALEAAKADFESAMGELNDLKDEFQSWYDNLPESLQQSAVGEKLEALLTMDTEIEIDLDSASGVIDEAESADLPIGFGRD